MSLARREKGSVGHMEGGLGVSNCSTGGWTERHEIQGSSVCSCVDSSGRERAVIRGCVSFTRCSATFPCQMWVGVNWKVTCDNHPLFTATRRVSEVNFNNSNSKKKGIKAAPLSHSQESILMLFASVQRNWFTNASFITCLRVALQSIWRKTFKTLFGLRIFFFMKYKVFFFNKI